MKLTDRLQYFHYSLVHPELNKPSLIYCQTLILKKLCSLERDFKEKLSEKKSWFFKKSYQEQIIGWEIKKMSFCENKKKNEINKKKGIPFAVTYHLN